MVFVCFISRFLLPILVRIPSLLSIKLYFVNGCCYRLAEKYEQISFNAKADLDEHLGHPINQYRLVKRLALEWSEVEELIKENVASS